jgi:hypothetical protein
VRIAFDPPLAVSVEAASVRSDTKRSHRVTVSGEVQIDISNHISHHRHHQVVHCSSLLRWSFLLQQASVL